MVSTATGMQAHGLAHAGESSGALEQSFCRELSEFPASGEQEYPQLSEEVWDSLLLSSQEAEATFPSSLEQEKGLVGTQTQLMLSGP